MTTATTPGTGWLPRGVRLDEATFSARHRVLLGITFAQVPLLALLTVLVGTAELMVWQSSVRSCRCCSSAGLRPVRPCAAARWP